MGKSKAQDKLMAELIELYPAAYITDEVYIGELVEERGYTLKELQRELGHKPHKMFVDIIMRDSDRTVAFEYHGEQHYSLVGNMTKTTADLLMNQQLDQEKSWILERIGIPLVAVPFDMYIDDSVIEHLIDEAYEQLDDAMSKLSECPECGRFFPMSQLSKGACTSCIEQAREAYEEEQAEQEREYAQARKERAAERREARRAASKAKRDNIKKKESASGGSSWRDFASSSGDDEYKEAQKEKAREYRKQRYQEWKNSPEYAAQKEEVKRKRKEAYQKQKAERAKQKLRERQRKNHQ